MMRYIGTRIVTFFGRPPLPGISTVTTHLAVTRRLRRQQFATGLGHHLGRRLTTIAVHRDNHRWHINRRRRESRKARCKRCYDQG